MLWLVIEMELIGVVRMRLAFDLRLIDCLDRSIESGEVDLPIQDSKIRGGIVECLRCRARSALLDLKIVLFTCDGRV